MSKRRRGRCKAMEGGGIEEMNKATDTTWRQP